MSGFEPSLKGRALRLLGQREHSRMELQRKLAPHDGAPGELNTVLDELQAKGFINEQRVIDSVLYRRTTKLGVARIRQELHGKGLDASMVLQALEPLQATEVQRARAVWCKKFDHVPNNAAERLKQMRFLLGRGFDSDAIRQVMAGGFDPDE